MKLFILKNKYRRISILFSFFTFIFVFFLISKISVYADTITPVKGYLANASFYYEQHSLFTQEYECFTLSGTTRTVTMRANSKDNWLYISPDANSPNLSSSVTLGSGFLTGYSFCAVLNKNAVISMPSGTYQGSISGGGASVSFTLVIYSSWVQVNNGGNVYSRGGYNLDNQSQLTNGLVFSGGGSSNFFTPPTNIVNNVPFILDNPIIYNFNFFTTLFCTNINNGCNSKNDLYSDGVINFNSINYTNPASCNSNANWYYYSSSISSFPNNICNNSIVLVNGYANISNSINQSNILIIANGNIVIDSGVNSVNTFLMSMKQIVIL